MSNEKTFIKVNEDLIINNVKQCKLDLLTHMETSDNLSLDFSEMKSIDITGLQLLIGLISELKTLDKSFSFSGHFTDDFMEEINNLIFTPNILTSGEDLSNFITDII